MITSLEIQGLRGIRAGKIEELAPLTILVGPNGCGKSTVLEAIGVVCAGGSAEHVFHALAAREWLGVDGMRYWVEPTRGARLTAQLDRHGADRRDQVSSTEISLGTKSIEVRWSISAPPGGSISRGGKAIVDDDGSVEHLSDPVPSAVPFVLQTISVDRPAGALKRLSTPRFSSALRDALTAIKLSPWYDSFLEYVKILRPSLQSIESLAVGDRDEPFMFESNPRRGYPMAYAGDGFRRALLLASTMARSKEGVAAMDEPEAFAHPSMFPALTHLIRQAIADGTQVFFATHSLEFIAAALEEFKADPGKVAVIGLTMDSGQLDPVVVSGPDAYTRVVELSHDLRL